jgi:hypothetical protein
MNMILGPTRGPLFVGIISFKGEYNEKLELRTDNFWTGDTYYPTEEEILAYLKKKGYTSVKDPVFVRVM